MHRLLDPVLSIPNRISAMKRLKGLTDGEYRVPVNVPYVAQFASPELIHRYIHEGFHGRDDPNWQAFGSQDVDSYTFWAHRACAIACLKMAIDGFQTSPPRSMWQLVEDGLSLGGYRTHDEHGNYVDEGWFYPPLIKLASNYGLQTIGMAYASLPDVCAALRDGWLIAAAVTPELGERGRLRRYDGHFVLIYGFVWQRGRCSALLLHNPSGRYAELQANSRIPSHRFGMAFAHRFIGFKAKFED
jgi:hypothetical protein